MSQTETAQSPDFDSIKNISDYGAEYGSTRDLAPLLGYNKWQNFEVAIGRAKAACEQVGQIVEHHFTAFSKMIILGKGGQREVTDYILSRFACYLIAQNGDPRQKPEIAAAQVYFAIAAREYELDLLRAEQDKRCRLITQSFFGSLNA